MRISRVLKNVTFKEKLKEVWKSVAEKVSYFLHLQRVERRVMNLNYRQKDSDGAFGKIFLLIRKADN